MEEKEKEEEFVHFNRKPGMDYNNNKDALENWMWQEDGLYCHEKGPSCDESSCTWNRVAVNQEDLSYMLDEAATPVKACGDLAYDVNRSGDSNKELEEQWEASRLKRRRTLQFDTRAREDFSVEVLPLASQWSSDFQDVSGSSYEGLDQQCEEWLAECLNDAEMHFSPDDINLSELSNIQIDISEFCNEPPESEANVVQNHATWARRNIIFKGRKSFIQTPKIPSSVAYPFAFVKPCGFQGDVTLKDINQLIHNPPPLKSKQNEEDPAAYPTSAFSGKPVVGKTKICTGGKGSITIMRTKG